MARKLALILMWLALCDGALADNAIVKLLAQAQQGDAKALGALRMELATTQGQSAEFQHVIEVFRAGALDRNAQAQFELGYLFEQGLGVPRDYHQAERWYQQAAQRGLTDAQFRLGRMYYEGLASGSNRRLGYIWLAIAAENGYQAALRYRDACAARLAPDDLAKARKEAAALLVSTRQGAAK